MAGLFGSFSCKHLNLFRSSEIAGVPKLFLQVKSGTLFDNIVVSDDPEYAKSLAEETWGKHKDAEKTAFEEAQKKKEEEV
ncbi:calreticulin [Genlisea aurea]|uniref:Calreticulin n=1 Tax=Genlisea aurea TaxID=192259 RepID=S8C1N1_9LAMI|nr:calreticulin [Genlisea aurea]